MRDFYFKIRKAIGNNTIERLIKDFSADPKLHYGISSKVVTINFEGGLDLRKIYERSLGKFRYNEEKEKGVYLAIEIPFVGIFDPAKLIFHRFLMGHTGSKDMCCWLEGGFLEDVCKKAQELDMKIALGHTHPVVVPDNGPERAYGAICSRIDWTKDDLIKFGDWLSLKRLETGIYKKFGGDYGAIWTLVQENELISNFALIMSPALNQLGIFEVNDGGSIVYHPFQIGLNVNNK